MNEFSNHIITYFDNLKKKSFSEWELRLIFDNNRSYWSIPKNKKFSSFLNFLLKTSYLIETIFNSRSGIKSVYAWKTEEDFTVISGLKNNSYYSHFSAMFLNGVTLQIPKTYYLNYEHSKIFPKGELHQELIDKVFSKEQRKTSTSYSFLANKIIILNGKKTDNLGVITKSNQKAYYKYTDLERTIVDISVRPAYSGGVFEVLEAYKNSIEKLDVKKLLKYLKKIDYTYPYHQVIGFYLEHAGFPENMVSLFEFEMPYKFYLTYNMRSKKFSERWNLYFPRAFA